MRIRTIPIANFVLICVGALLLLAASLKTHELLTTRVTAEGGATFQASIILLESILAGWLFSGVAPSWARRVSIALFVLFLLLNVRKGVIGEESCGCFGTLRVDPWTSAAIDLGCLFSLLGWGEVTKSFRLPRVVNFIGGFLLLGLAFWLISVAVSKDREAAGLKRLDISKSIGQYLPLLDGDLVGCRNIDWSRMRTVIFHQPGCSKCEELLVRLHRERLSNPEFSDGDLCFIEVPPETGGPTGRPPLFGLRCKLNPEQRWFVKVPTVVQLNNGRIERVSSDLQ